MSRQIKLRPNKMDHVLNFLSWFVPCTRLTINAWCIKFESLKKWSPSSESLRKISFKPTQYRNYKGIKEKLSKILKIKSSEMLQIFWEKRLREETLGILYTSNNQGNFHLK